MKRFCVSTFVLFLCFGATAEESENPWRLSTPLENICYGSKQTVVWGNSFDGKLENAVNIQDELLRLPWKDIYVFLSPRDHQWGSSELSYWPSWAGI